MNHVAQIVCAQKQIPKMDLLSKTRKGHVVEARQIYVYIMFTVFHYKNGELARITGFDHATIGYCIKTVNNRVETEAKYREDLEKIIYLCERSVSNRNKYKVSRRIAQNKQNKLRKPLILAS